MEGQGASSARSSMPSPSTGAEAAVPPRRRLSYKEQREFDSLPARIEELEAAKSALDAQVADPAFYSQDRDTVREALARVPQLAAEIDAAYARWADLEARGGR